MTSCWITVIKLCQKVQLSRLIDRDICTFSGSYNKLYAMLKRANAQIAHLVFANTQNANQKNPKELFYAKQSDNLNGTN